jgi:hypothetical protein
MPSVPGTGFQLVMLLLFVLPGSVYQFVRSRLRGPHPDDSSATNRVLRALAVSAGLVTVYAIAAGAAVLEQVAEVQQPDAAAARSSVRPLAIWAFLLLFVIPAALAVVGYVASRLPRPRRLGGWRLTYDPTPRAWDFAFNDIDPKYVRILTADGRYLGGWYGRDSFVSSYPEPREIFLESANLMEPDGSFGREVDGSAGLYVRCDDVRLIEFVDGIVASNTEQSGPRDANAAKD